jgi:hypothetical protein
MIGVEPEDVGQKRIVRDCKRERKVLDGKQDGGCARVMLIESGTKIL